MAATHLPEGPEAPVRVGYAITTKVGAAVVRNRLRRRLRATCTELARTRPGSFPTGALVIAAGPAAVHRTPDELSSDVARLLDALRSRRPTSSAAR